MAHEDCFSSTSSHINAPATTSAHLDERPAVARLESLLPSEGASSSLIAPEALTVPRQHPQTHGIPVGILNLRSYDTNSLSLFVHFVLHAAYAFGIPASRAAALPNKRSLYTVIRSPFVHKKSQENFERIVHRRAIKIWDTDMDVFNKWARYLEINGMAGVDMRFVRWERVEVGFGQKRLTEVVKYEQALWEQSQKGGPGSKARAMNSKEQVANVAREVVEAEIAAARAVDEALASLDPRFRKQTPSASSPSSGSSPSAASPAKATVEVTANAPAAKSTAQKMESSPETPSALPTEPTISSSETHNVVAEVCQSSEHIIQLSSTVHDFIMLILLLPFRSKAGCQR